MKTGKRFCSNTFRVASSATLLLVAFVAFSVCSQGADASSMPDSSADSYLWLEDVLGDKALDWVRQQNAVSTNELQARPEFELIRQRLLSIMDSKDRIPFVTKHGKFVYNFWRDDKNVCGLWRRTTLKDYKNPQPNWETVLDLDQLAASEKENWVWKSANVLEPDYDRCLVSLSRGGADATVVREFDLKTKRFVEGGFKLAEAKNRVDWRNRNTIYVGTDFGPNTMTKSGYPRIVKEWKRGVPLSSAKMVFEGKVDDVSASGSVVRDHGKVYEFMERSPTFFTDEVLVRRGDKWVRIDKPADAEVRTFGAYLLLKLRTDWRVDGKTYVGGSLLASDFDSYLKGERKFTTLFAPSERKSLEAISATKNYLILTELDNVRSRPYLLRPARGEWKRTPVDVPAFGNVSVHGIDADESDDYFMVIEDFLTPSTLYLGTAGKPAREKLKSLPAYFNVDGLEIQQFETKSADGTRVPYFQISRQGMKLDGSNPTLLYGYGGFNISMLPAYSPTVGAGWLESGGVYVLANIRGGGEFGPKWHDAARKEHRQRAYDDFIAVAEDLIARKVTAPKRLGIQGGSNGGLLMGVMLTERPDLFGAVLCQVPLLDMRRFNKLLAGASWMDEYGDPDKPDEWEYISKFSPYQNVQKDRKYPRVLFTTSTRDDRVHPGHARKMVARMKEQGHDVLYYENIEGGHGGAANNKQAAYMRALAYTFLLKELK
jgi:prolyl oligopeptidase